MSREDLMRISRALALFRPSVLASMMNLTEDDLIFTEKSLQRTLLVSVLVGNHIYSPPFYIKESADRLFACRNMKN